MKTKKIFTKCYSVKEADNLGHFIMSKRYEGLYNDSYRGCLTAIKFAFDDNLKLGIDHVYVGVNHSQMVLGRNKTQMKNERCYHYVEDVNTFKELLSK